MVSSLHLYGWTEVSIFVNLHQSLFIISGFSRVSIRRYINALVRSLACPRRADIIHSSFTHSFIHSFFHFQAQFNLATVGQFLPCSFFPSQPSPPPPSPSWKNTRPSQSINFTTADGIAIIIIIIIIIIIMPTPNDRFFLRPSAPIDDKNKGVVDRSSTVVARDVLERAAAANEGNYSASPSCSWQQSAGRGRGRHGQQAIQACRAVETTVGVGSNGTHAHGGVMSGGRTEGRKDGRERDRTRRELGQAAAWPFFDWISPPFLPFFPSPLSLKHSLFCICSTGRPTLRWWPATAPC